MGWDLAIYYNPIPPKHVCTYCLRWLLPLLELICLCCPEALLDMIIQQKRSESTDFSLAYHVHLALIAC